MALSAEVRFVEVGLFFVHQLQQVPTVGALLEGFGQPDHLLGVYVPHAVGDLFRAGDLEVLPLFDGLDEVGGLLEGLVGPRVQPGHPAAQDLDLELTPLEVSDVDVRYLQLATRRRLEVLCCVQHLVVVEVEPRDRVVGFGVLRLLFYADDTAVALELDHAVALGVLDVVAEDRRPAIPVCGLPQGLAETLPVEDVVPQYQRDGLAANEVPPDDKGLGQPLGPRLHGVLQVQPPPGPIFQQLLEPGQVRGGRDQEYVPDARQHQRRERVVDKGLVVDREELLADHVCQRVEPRAGPPGQDYALHRSTSPRRPSCAAAANRAATPTTTSEIHVADFNRIDSTDSARWSGDETYFSAIRLAISCPIGIEAVAAGEGALRTWTEFSPSEIRKSSTIAPSSLSAWALTPAEMGTTSPSSTSGTSFLRPRTNAFLLTERWISPIPVRQFFLASRQSAG